MKGIYFVYMFCLVFLAGSMVSTAAAADDAPVAVSEQTPVSAATAAEAEKIVCKTVKVTGSNVRTRKVCTTPASAKANQDWARDQQDRAAINASSILNSGGN